MKLPVLKFVPALLISAVAITISGVAPQAAEASDNRRNAGAIRSGELPPYLQCVPYARQISGIRIFGDAHTWWSQAAGRFERGTRPRIGAVMAFQPHRKMRLGHVAAVSRVIDSRTVLLKHSNWSPINGRRGQIEDDVRAIDVSPNNDWSQVRVWYHPLQALGKTAWPVHGFIYNGNHKGGAKPGRQFDSKRIARVAPFKPAALHPARAQSSRAFLSAFGNLDAVKKPATRSAVRNVRTAPHTAPPARIVKAMLKPKSQSQQDRVAAAISRYD
ncbi:CHAP domain-containing protein [Alteripontixanthobacter maritimus]|nr:CHAP domain-containing protein [Alteripontixanthobacter maritimus]